MDEKTCCVTDHRDISKEHLDYVEQELRREVQAAIEDGYTRFISGFAEGLICCLPLSMRRKKRGTRSSFWRRRSPIPDG